MDGSDFDRINYIKAVLVSQGWNSITHIAETTNVNGFFGMIGAHGDPFFSVLAECLKQIYMPSII